jgi:DNA modification methylase
MIIEKRKLTDLNLAEYNPRTHSPEFLEQLGKSITEFGFIDPIIWNKRTNNVVGGHARLKVLLEQGVKEAEVSVVDLDVKKEKALNVSLNKVSGEWDEDLLSSLLSEIKADGNLDLTGFNDDELNELLSTLQPDLEPLEEDPLKDVPERCAAGDLWQLGEHRLLCGDATKKEDVERLMGGKKADMVFTDPPYSVSIGKKNRDLQTVGIADRNTNDIIGDDLPIEEIAEKLWKPAFLNMSDALSEGAGYYVTAPQGGDQMMMMMMMMMNGSMRCRHELIWVKSSPTFSMGRLDYSYQHEPILYGWKGTNRKFYGTNERSVWEIDKANKCDLHPTMKPIELMEKAILNSSLQNQIVLDVFGGSGSTLIACERTNRKCFMCEIDERYCDVIIQRWENLTGKKAKQI